MAGKVPAGRQRGQSRRPEVRRTLPVFPNLGHCCTRPALRICARLGHEGSPSLDYLMRNLPISRCDGAQRTAAPVFCRQRSAQAIGTQSKA